MKRVKLNLLANGRLMICFPKTEAIEHHALKVALAKTPKEKYYSQGGFEVYIIGKQAKKNKKQQQEKE